VISRAAGDCLRKESVNASRDPRRILILFAALAAAVPLRAQIVSSLEPDRPISFEDAHAIPYRALSGSIDWTQNWHRSTANDYGPGLSLLYGVARGLELGGSLRYVTSPSANSQRGISSGDLMLHALYDLHEETSAWPALAARVGVEFPTGLDSKGTDLRLAALATRTLGVVRLHANFAWTRLGDTTGAERKDRLEAIAGVDFFASSRGLTDALLLADVAIRSNPVREEATVVTLEGGTRLRIGSQTVFFAGAGSDIAGGGQRARFRLRVGVGFFY
jgi:hypothetical protein